MQASYPFKLIVFDVEKNQNVAMLLRSAYALGCQEVLVAGRPKFKLTGAQGAHAAQPYRRFYGLRDAVADAKQAGYSILGLEIGGTPIDQVDFARPVAFLPGNEGRGLDHHRRYCDEIVQIPQWGGVPSMNVAVATSIAMYEFMRRQQRPLAPRSGDRFYDEAFPLPSSP